MVFSIALKNDKRVVSSNPALDTNSRLSREPLGDLSVARGECLGDSVVAVLG